MAHELATAGQPVAVHDSKLGARRERLEREFGAKEKDGKVIGFPEFSMQSCKDNPSVVPGGVVHPDQGAREKTAGRLHRILAAALRSSHETNTQYCVELREYFVNVNGAHLVNAAHVKSMEPRSIERNRLA